MLGQEEDTYPCKLLLTVGIISIVIEEQIMRDDVVNHSGCREGYTLDPAEVNLLLEYNNKEKLLIHNLYMGLTTDARL